MEEKQNKEKNDLLLSENIQRKGTMLFGLVEDYSNPSHIPYKDKVYLTPTEKYRIYGKFPTRLVFDLALAVLATIQVLMINSPTTEYGKAVERFFYDIFLQNDDTADKEITRFKYIYKLDDLIKFVRESKDNYLKLKEYSIGNLTFLTPDESNITIPLSIDYVARKIEEYNMTKDDYWIFNTTNNNSLIKKNINKIKSFTIEYNVNTYDPYNFGDYYECTSWDVKQIFGFERRFHFSVSLDISFSTCEDISKNGNSFIKGNFWIPTIIAVLSLINIILTLRSLVIGYKYYLNFQYRYSKDKIKIERENKSPKIKSKWDMLRKKDKNNIISRFNYLQIIGNTVQLFGALLCLYEAREVILINKYIVGIGAALSYTNLLKYLKFYPNFQTIINTLSKSIPYLILYFVGTLPIFLCFVVFALANFPFSERFYSFTRIILQLFGMMNGDSILDIINDILDNSYFLGHIYIYLFVTLFFWFVINIFVSIIEDSFVSSKMKNQDHWIYSLVKKNQDKNEDIGIKSKKEIKLYDEMRRKKLIRNVLSKSRDNLNELNDPSIIAEEKEQLTTGLNESIQDFDNFFNGIKDEIKNITNEIKESKNCKLKHELKQYILKRISNLQKLINEEKNSV